ncbi:MAG: hypothetical protein ACHQCG_07435 [Solirubrobacterales bacterium]
MGKYKSMDGGIITLPLRVGVGGARVLLRTAGCAAKLTGRATVAATETAARVSDTLTWGRPAPSFEPPPEAASAPDVSDLRAAPEHSVNGDRSESPRIPPIAPPPEPEPPTPVEPVHVSEEPELVSEVAEPGAEDGAGASVTIKEPWQGYARMTAKQVIERLADATPAELAAVQLYESINRDRQTVRAAAERNLKSKTGRGSPD